MIPDFKTYINETYWSERHQHQPAPVIPQKDGHLSREKIEDFIDKSLDVYAELYVQEGWADEGEELTYDIFASVVKTSDSMTGNMAVEGIEDYEDYTEEELDKILQYAKQKWHIYSKKLEEYCKEWEDFWNKKIGN